MITVPGMDEIGKTTRSFFDVLREQSLSLALGAVILVLVRVAILQHEPDA